MSILIKLESLSEQKVNKLPNKESFVKKSHNRPAAPLSSSSCVPTCETGKVDYPDNSGITFRLMVRRPESDESWCGLVRNGTACSIAPGPERRRREEKKTKSAPFTGEKRRRRKKKRVRVWMRVHKKSGLKSGQGTKRLGPSGYQLGSRDGGRGGQKKGPSTSTSGPRTMHWSENSCGTR
ncbi:hypothetical protein GWI33_021410 [Rhynchophorus ferrugineus]|uniref:Uncharacterized protein n=1 Tax=Rhynchophorus ferrugineus TaxID=354439 RepID=A0A834HQJ6_RHYFE|nr:hypothetical protein GWI33_021410 [Rhynchophorus ferrugineus]